MQKPKQKKTKVSPATKDSGGVANDLPPSLASACSESSEVTAEIYRQVGKEILDDRLEPASWARSLAECGGTRDEALTHYVRHRAEALLQEKKRQVPKVKNFERRRVGNFRDFHSEPIIPHTAYGESKSVSLVDALFWHGVAVVGMLGCFLAVGLLWPEWGFQLTWTVALLIVLAMQCIPLIGWWVGRRADHTLAYSRVTRMAATVAMLASVGIGVRLLMTPSQSEGFGLYRKEILQKASLVRFPGEVEHLATEKEEKPIASVEQRR